MNVKDFLRVCKGCGCFTDKGHPHTFKISIGFPGNVCHLGMGTLKRRQQGVGVYGSPKKKLPSTIKQRRIRHIAESIYKKTPKEKRV